MAVKIRGRASKSRSYGVTEMRGFARATMGVMHSSLDAEQMTAQVLPCTGTAAARVDAYALAMGCLKPALSMKECMAAAHIAEAGRGTCRPAVVAHLDAVLRAAPRMTD